MHTHIHDISHAWEGQFFFLVRKRMSVCFHHFGVMIWSPSASLLTYLRSMDILHPFSRNDHPSEFLKSGNQAKDLEQSQDPMSFTVFSYFNVQFLGNGEAEASRKRKQERLVGGFSATLRSHSTPKVIKPESWGWMMMMMMMMMMKCIPYFNWIFEFRKFLTAPRVRENQQIDIYIYTYKPQNGNYLIKWLSEKVAPLKGSRSI